MPNPNTKHTSGPWETVKPKFLDPNCTRHIEDANGHLIARINFANPVQSENEAIANARLIALAPDLLETLDNVRATLSTMIVTFMEQMSQADYDARTGLLEQAEDLINRLGYHEGEDDEES